MKKLFVYSIDLGLVWCFVSGNISIINFLLGSILGYALLSPLKILYNSKDDDYSLEDLILKIPSLAKYSIKLVIEVH